MWQIRFSTFQGARKKCSKVMEYQAEVRIGFEVLRDNKE
jgi:hypothetical protein